MILNNKLKTIALFSLSPRPANTGSSSAIPMTGTTAEAKEISFYDSCHGIRFVVKN